MTSLTKKPETKNFFSLQTLTCQIFCGFEQLSSAIVSGGSPMQKHTQTAGF